MATPGYGADGRWDGAQLEEGLGQFASDDGLVADIERLEDGLVDEPADGVVAATVERVEVFAEDLERQVERFGHVLVVDAQAGDQGLGVLAARADAGLLLVEELATDAVLVVHL